MCYGIRLGHAIGWECSRGRQRSARRELFARSRDRHREIAVAHQRQSAMELGPGFADLEGLDCHEVQKKEVCRHAQGLHRFRRPSERADQRRCQIRAGDTACKTAVRHFNADLSVRS